MSQLVWLITGCSSGLELLVREVLSRGGQVIATARRLESIKQLEEAGAHIMQLDVTSDQQVLHQKVAEAITIYGRIDVLVNNAGYVEAGTFEDLEPNQLLGQFETNVFGVHKLTRAVLPHLREKKSGTMIFISSLSGWVAEPFIGAYNSSKFALEGLVEALALETEPLGIKSILIEPGRFRTKLLSPENLKQVQQSIIPEYVDQYRSFLEGVAKADRAQPGDPQKCVEVIADLAWKEGCAAGKEVPLRLPLGIDCFDAVKKKCDETLKLLEAWKPVIRGTNLGEPGMVPSLYGLRAET